MLLVWDWLIIVTVHCRKQVIGVRVHLLLYPSLLSLFLHCRVCNICTVCHLGPVHRPPGNTSGNVILCCPASPSELLSHDAHWAVSFYTAADTNEKVLLLPFMSSSGKRILDFLFLQAINFFLFSWWNNYIYSLILNKHEDTKCILLQISCCGVPACVL